MKRIDFISQACLVCFGLAAGLSIEGCGPLPIYTPSIENKIITIEKSKVAMNKISILQHKSLPYDILLVKTNEKYEALLMRCSHQNQPLVATNSGLFCNAHGSSFNLKGEATKEPAYKPLKKYKTILQEDKILIYLS